MKGNSLPAYSREPDEKEQFTQKIDRVYTVFAGAYDLAVKALPVWKSWLKQALPHIRGPKVLEVSFGTGYLLTQYADRFETHGIDYNEKMVSVASDNLKKKGITAILQQGNVESLPYQDESFGTDDVNAGRSVLCTPAEVAQGGHIQQSVTDAFLARAFRADIALQNSGGVRIDIETGDISIADAYELLPFANTLYELEMTGAEIVTALEQGLGNVIDAGGSSGAYPYGAGIRWDVDVSEDPGSRFSNVEVRPKGASTWSPINPTATYIVVANSFMVGGGDGYQVLADVNADGRGVDTFLDYAQSWIDWIVEDQSGTIARPTEFSTQSYLPVPDLP